MDRFLNTTLCVRLATTSYRHLSGALADSVLGVKIAKILGWSSPSGKSWICHWGKLTKLTYDKQHFYDDVRDDWRSFWRHKGSVVRNDDRYVECTEKNQPIPADFKYPIMQQDEPWPFDFLYFVFWKSVCLNSS